MAKQTAPGTPMPPPPPPPPTPAEKPVQAFALIRREGGWVMVAYTIQGDQVVSKTSTEPDLRILAIEAFKIASYKSWVSQ